MIPYPGRQIPVSVVTGFLGAGKTTLLARLLRHPRFRRTAVVINEFGEVPLDHELVEAVEEDVVEISGGCLCCTVRGDLARAIGALDRRRRHDEAPAFERLLIETTGLADPAPILHTLMADPMIDDGYRLDGVIALVDAVTGLATLDRQPEAVKQLAMADRILVTKTDLTGDRIPVMLADRIAALAPTATVACANRGQTDPDRLFDLGPWRTRTRQADIECWPGEAARAHGHQHAHGHDPNRHGEAIRAFCLRRSDPVTTDALLLFLELLTGSAGPNLLRMKGIIRLAEEPDRPVVLHMVQHLFHEPLRLEAWPSADRDTRLVFVVHGIEAASIAKLFDTLAATCRPAGRGR